MSTERPLDSDIAVAALRLFSPQVRASILEDAEFRRRFSLGVDAVVRFEQNGAEFARSALFRAVRQILAGTAPSLEVESKDGGAWRVTHDVASGVIVSREGVVVSLAGLACVSPDVNARIEWFDRESTKCRIIDDRTGKWREVLAERPLEDEEVGLLLDEFRLTPAHSAATIRERLRNRNFNAADLVPADLRYFDRLVGEPPDETSVHVFISSVLASHLRALVEQNACEGLKAALLLSSHPLVSEVVDLKTVPHEEVLAVFQWLTDRGDRISQVGAIECGLRHLDTFPEIEPSLTAMTRTIGADDLEDPLGRHRLLSGLVALVEGEIVRRSIVRLRPPFWRRMASIAHAALIEREVLAANLETTNVADWALESGGALYYMQTLIDLRREPRWFPDLISPQQLKAEFVGRIAGAAERYRKNVRDGELSSLLWGDDSGSIQSQKVFPSAFLPGPLEGGTEAVIDIPAELETSIRTSLEAEELTAESFFGLVNSSLIFRIGSQLSELAAQGLRRVGYQLRKVSANDDPFSLLNGLATVSAVTRSKALADEVRILSRAARRRAGNNLTPEAIARIALVAAAANNDLTAWSNFVGDWLTELAFADMTREQALALQGDLYRLLHVEPVLWETCGRAEAALSAFVGSLPDDADESHHTAERGPH